MTCLSLPAVENFLIWLIIILAIVALLKLLVPYIMAQFGNSAPVIVVSAINIVVWAVVGVALIIFIFTLISCLAGWHGGIIR